MRKKLEAAQRVAPGRGRGSVRRARDVASLRARGRPLRQPRLRGRAPRRGRGRARGEAAALVVPALGQPDRLGRARDREHAARGAARTRPFSRPVSPGSARAASLGPDLHLHSRAMKIGADRSRCPRRGRARRRRPARLPLGRRLRRDRLCSPARFALRRQPEAGRGARPAERDPDQQALPRHRPHRARLPRGREGPDAAARAGRSGEDVHPRAGSLLRRPRVRLRVPDDPEERGRVRPRSWTERLRTSAGPRPLRRRSAHPSAPCDRSNRRPSGLGHDPAAVIDYRSRPLNPTGQCW